MQQRGPLPDDHWECHDPAGEILPLVVRLDASDGAALAASLATLGARVLRPRDPRAAQRTWPEALDDAVARARREHGRAYVLRVTTGAPAWRIAGGLPGTPAEAADPWSVALLVGAARDAGVALGREPGSTGTGATDELQGFDLRRPAGTGSDAVLAAIVGALADGLRIAQLKC